MSAEIEAKMKVSDLSAIRKRLESAGAKYQRKELETNTFFDAEDHRLQNSDRGLRIREAVDENKKSRFTVTMKGPLQKGQYKSREEIQFTIDKPDEARDLFKNLGYSPTLSFEKRRETWEIDDCEVTLDELPYLGMFVEIEGNEKAIAAVCEKLGLSSEPLISTGYISLLWRYLQEHRISRRDIRLEDHA